MTDRITTFNLHWYDCGLTCAENVVHEEITVYRNKKVLKFVECNGYNERVTSEEIKLDADLVEQFFNYLEINTTRWKTDYRVFVCDGSSWKVRMWHSSHKVTIAKGTVEYPPKGKQIEKYIRSFIENGRSLIDPRLFGCGR